MRAQITGFSALSLSVLTLPVLASAQVLGTTLAIISNLLNGVIGLFVTLAIVVFFWGLIKYLTNKGEEMAKEGVNLMFWGIVAIFVMVSVWGIIRLLQNTFQVQNGQAIVPNPIVVGSPGVTATIGLQVR